MNRRYFLKSLLSLSAAPWLKPPAAARVAPAAPRQVLLQASPVAGFQYHHGQRVWTQMRPGDPLRLVRQADNAYDENAIAIFWNEIKLGYVPRAENVTLAQLLDRGQMLAAVLTAMRESYNPWERLTVEIWLVLS